MPENNSRLPLHERRSFLTRLSAAVTAFVAGNKVLAAEPQSTLNALSQPGRHEIDDWMDKAPAKHRLVFDTANAESFGNALPFSNNFYTGNQNGYGLKEADVAVIIVARHSSTAFAYNDAMWAKYGAMLGKRAGFTDPKTKDTPKANLFFSPDYGDALPNRGTALDVVIKRGVQFAVCQLATRANSRAIAMATGGDADTIYNELAANLIPNSHLVSAGIVAVNRAQERGYTFAHG
jgi:hypothetical protein